MKIFIQQKDVFVCEEISVKILYSAFENIPQLLWCGARAPPPPRDDGATPGPPCCGGSIGTTCAVCCLRAARLALATGRSRWATLCWCSILWLWAGSPPTKFQNGHLHRLRPLTSLVVMTRNGLSSMVASARMSLQLGEASAPRCRQRAASPSGILLACAVPLFSSSS